MRKLKIGDRVCIKDEGTEGKIIDIDDEMVTVDLGKPDGCWIFRRDDLVKTKMISVKTSIVIAAALALVF